VHENFPKSSSAEASHIYTPVHHDHAVTLGEKSDSSAFQQRKGRPNNRHYFGGALAVDRRRLQSVPSSDTPDGVPSSPEIGQMAWILCSPVRGPGRTDWTMRNTACHSCSVVKYRDLTFEHRYCRFVVPNGVKKCLVVAVVSRSEVRRHCCRVVPNHVEKCKFLSSCPKSHLGM